MVASSKICVEINTKEDDDDDGGVISLSLRANDGDKEPTLVVVGLTLAVLPLRPRGSDVEGRFFMVRCRDLFVPVSFLGGESHRH